MQCARSEALRSRKVEAFLPEWSAHIVAKPSDRLAVVFRLPTEIQENKAVQKKTKTLQHNVLDNKKPLLIDLLNKEGSLFLKSRLHSLGRGENLSNTMKPREQGISERK